MKKNNLFKFSLLIVLSALAYLSYTLKESLHTNIIDAQDNIIALQEIDVHNFAKNIDEHLRSKTDNCIVSSLVKDPILRTLIEDELSLLITKKYRYAFVLYPDKKHFRFLLDGSTKEEKSQFGTIFLPENQEYWQKMMQKKSPFIIEQKEINTLWKSYIYPVIINDKIEVLIVIDFAAKEAKNLLGVMEPMLKIADYIYIFIFTLLIFTYIFVISSLFLKTKVDSKEKELRILNASLEEKIKRAVQENQEKDKMLQDQSRLALMGEMISMIAHQWRQPLSAISAASFGIQLKANSPKLDFSEQKDREIFLQFLDETLDKIAENTQFLSTTIDDFRTFFQSDKKKQISTLEIPLRRALHIVQASLESKEIMIEVDINTDDEILMYQNEFMQVILNLIKNAEDVLVHNKVKEPKIKIKIYKESHYYIFELLDNGGGINDDIRDKIFNPYFSTKMEKDGTGLGLYMSKVMIEEHHNGILEVYNKDDGACFKIKLDETAVSVESKESK